MVFAKVRKMLLRIVAVTIAAVLIFIITCNVWVVLSTSDQVYNSLSEVPQKKVALVLGTSKYSRQGRSNPYFNHRMNAAKSLYYSNKIEDIIISGDNSLSYYNEPKDMRKYLRTYGIPDSVIYPDYAGFRTFDSVVRCKKVFGQDDVIVVTQKFHVYRALFISNFYNMNAVGYIAENEGFSDSYDTLLREYFARCKAVIDLFILNKQPKFLGKEIIS
ncbi:MAG: vancomycin high temperature exclusion protein [Cytophagaceae bacterium]